MLRRTWIMSLFAVGVVALAMNAPVRAGLIPVSVTVQPEAGNFRWTYSVTLPTDMKLQSGDYFTVYDFAGYQNGTGKVTAAAPGLDAASAANWSFSTALTGQTPAGLSPTDNPAIENLTWTYNGPTLTGQLGLGNFVATSLFQAQVSTNFTAINPRASDGSIDKNLTDTFAPTGEVGPPPQVPEPATLALLGIGLPLVGGARLVRRRRK